MSTEPTPIILGPRGDSVRDESAVSDFQVVVGKILAILTHRRWLFVIPLLTGMLTALLVSLFLPRRYCIISVFERRDDVVTTKLVTSTSNAFEMLRHSMEVDLIGYDACSKAFDDLGLTNNFPQDDHGQLTPEGKQGEQELISSIKNDLKFTWLDKQRDLDLVKITYLGDKPVIAAQLLNKLFENYIKQMRVEIANVLESTHEFFDQQASESRKKAAILQSDLSKMLSERPWIDPAQSDQLEKRLAEHKDSLEKIARRRAETESSITAQEESLGELLGEEGTVEVIAKDQPDIWDPTWMPNPKRQQLAQEMDNIRSAIADAKAERGLKDAHPDIQVLNNKLERRRLEFEREPPRIPRNQDQVSPNTNEDALTNLWGAEKRRIKLELKSLGDTLAQLDADAQKHQADTALLQQEKQTLSKNQEQYLLYQQELQRIRADVSVWEDHMEKLRRVLTAEEKDRGAKFAILERARIPSKPFSPTFSGVLLLTLGVGLALGTAVVFFVEMFDRSFRDPARVRQALGIPILETIGEIHAGQRQGWFSKRGLMRFVASAQTVMVLGMMALVYCSLEQPALYDRILARSVLLITG